MCSLSESNVLNVEAKTWAAAFSGAAMEYSISSVKQFCMQIAEIFCRDEKVPIGQGGPLMG
jgi:hypothetical protein